MDAIGAIVEQWRAAGLGLDPEPMLVVGRIHRLSQIMDAALRPTFAAAGLAEGDFNILAALRRAVPDHERTAGDLHRALMVSTGAITKQVDRLAARGLVTRTTVAQDGRVRRIALTPDGCRLVDGLIVTHLERERELLSALTGAEREALASGLAKLADNLESGARPQTSERR